MSNDIQTVAYHEAGHAFADFKLGFKIKSVTITPEGEAAGLTTGKSNLRLHQLEYGEILTGKQIGRYHDYVVTLLAGEEAQRHFRPRSIRRHHSASDYAKVADFLFRLHGEEKDRNCAMRYLRVRARNLISPPVNWRRIEDLAKALLERKTLSGEEVGKILVASLQAQMKDARGKRGSPQNSGTDSVRIDP